MNRLQTDTALLFLSRMLRLFAYGGLSLVLMLYLDQLGMHKMQVGMLLTLTLLGDTLLSLWITHIADRVGRRTMLILGAMLMASAGFGFALTRNSWWLLLFATLGIISPSGNEVGPFLAIEQTVLSQLSREDKRTRLFAWYNLVGTLAASLGAWATGTLVENLQHRGFSTLASYRASFVGYGLMGIFLGIIPLFLGTQVESPSRERVESKSFLPRLNSPGRSRGVALKLASLFALDAFGGGFILQSIMAYWFHARFGANTAQLGLIFFSTNLFAAFSALGAERLARRYGLLNTMVFTHLPSSLLLMLVPLMPNFASAVVMLVLRSGISQMDVPTRQAYTVAVVPASERSATLGITGVARTLGAAISPALAGVLLSWASLAAAPFYCAGMIKIVYDLWLFKSFRGTK